MTIHPYQHSIPAEILALSHERDQLRRRGQYERADRLKQQIEDAGYQVKDNPRGAHLVILPSVEVDGKLYRTGRQLPSLLEAPDICTFSVNVLAHNTYEQTQRCIQSVLRFVDDVSLELMIVDNASQDGFDLWAETLKYQDSRIHILRTTRPMGQAEARNIGIKQSRGRYIVLLDSSVEVAGDIFTPLAKTLSNKHVGITGLRGLQTEDLRHFEESQKQEVDAVDGLCMAFPRSLLTKVGLFDERYRFSHYMDIDFSFAVRDANAEIVVTPALPVILHPKIQDTRMSEAERARLTKRNFYRFLEKWGDRDDLLPDEE